MLDINEIFKLALKKYSIEELSVKLSLNRNTIRRWIEKNNVPKNYYFDMAKIMDIKINYEDFSFQEKDQFFTSLKNAEYCVNKTREILFENGIRFDDYYYIEPSAGDGSFLNFLDTGRTIALDIEPKNEKIIKQDFFDFIPNPNNKYITIGNPPFGLRGNLALRFINKAAEYSDFVCFILPQLFESSGKGNAKDRVKNLYLIHSEKIDSAFIFPDGKKVNVNVVFQIWSKNIVRKEEKIDLSNILDIYSLSDGGTSSTTRNKKYLNICDIYLPSTCFGKDCIKTYNSFEELPNRRGYGIIFKDKEIKFLVDKIKWDQYSFVSTNNAYNLRMDIIKKAISDAIP